MKRRHLALSLLLFASLGVSCSNQLAPSSSEASRQSSSGEPWSSDGLLISNGVVSSYYGEARRVQIPETYEGVPVTAIGSNAFMDSKVTEVSLPQSVDTIGASAFENCTSLKAINIPEGLKTLGKAAFKGCNVLVSLSIPNGVTKILDETFYLCKTLKTLTLPESLESIGANAFFRCSSLRCLEIPETVTSIGASAFQSCISLESFSVPAAVTKIAPQTFEACQSIKSITFNGDLESIGVGAFRDCESLQSMVVPNGVTKIEQDTFRGCLKIKSITLPDGIESIEDCGIASCNALETINLPDGLKTIAYSAFSYDYALQYIGLGFPDSLTSIGNFAFVKCGLKSVVIPNHVTSIGRNAFENCSAMTDIYIPSSVTSMGTEAFLYCYQVKIVCEAEKEPYGWDRNWNPEDRPVTWGQRVSSSMDSSASGPHGPADASLVGWYLVGEGVSFSGWNAQGGIQLWSNPNNEKDDLAIIKNVAMEDGDVFKFTDGGSRWLGYEIVTKTSFLDGLSPTSFTGVNDGNNGRNFQCNLSGSYTFTLKKSGGLTIAVYE